MLGGLRTALLFLQQKATHVLKNSAKTLTVSKGKSKSGEIMTILITIMKQKMK